MINIVKKIYSVGLIFFCIHANLLNAAADNQVSTRLLRLLDTDNLSVRYTTLMLLSHTALNDQDIDKLIKFASKEKDQVIKLAAYYVLAKRTQETKFVKLFIENYPYGELQKKISNYHWTKSQYISDISVSSPLQAYLAELANDNNLAIEKLISGFYFSDSTEDLNSQITELYKRNPDRVKPLLKKYNVDETIIKQYIK